MRIRRIIFKLYSIYLLSDVEEDEDGGALFPRGRPGHVRDQGHGRHVAHAGNQAAEEDGERRTGGEVEDAGHDLEEVEHEEEGGDAGAAVEEVAHEGAEDHVGEGDRGEAEAEVVDVARGDAQRLEVVPQGRKHHGWKNTHSVYCT